MDDRPAPVPRRLMQAPGLAAVMTDDCADIVVTGVTLDSRAVRPGDLYAALPGAHTHGARFGQQAVARGAAALLTDQTGAALLADAGVPVVVVHDPRLLLGELSAWIYGYPSRELTMFGVTGTNGKTTMTYLLSAGLKAAGEEVGVIGTIGIRIADQDLPSARTTPEAPDVHALLAVMRERGITSVAMEVSSHALALGRVDGLQFDLAVFTNLTQDHLDFHHDMEQYYAAKRGLFTPGRSKRGVVCVDDDWGRRLTNESDVPVVTYGLTAGDWRLTDINESPSGSWSALATARGTDRVPVSSALPGAFNRANVLGTLAALVSAGYDAAATSGGLARCDGVPGRMQPVGGADFAAFVDYAHTPDAVARAISAVREFSPGRVLVALGCGGDRDTGKRPQMGRVAALGADMVVVTDDNPRSEDPAMIRSAVLAGAQSAHSGALIIEVGDRREAIGQLVSAADSGDVVLVLGKGHEQGQEIAGVVTPFDDRVVLAAAIARRGAA